MGGGGEGGEGERGRRGGERKREERGTTGWEEEIRKDREGGCLVGGENLSIMCVYTAKYPYIITQQSPKASSNESVLIE